MAGLLLGAMIYAFGPSPSAVAGAQGQAVPNAPQPGNSLPQGMQVVTVPMSNIGATVTLGGTVVPYKEVTLAAQIPGRVEYIAGTEGARFEQGQVLVAIDDDDLVAQRRQALAEIGRAESDLLNAQVQYSRELWSPQSRSVGQAPGMGMPFLFDQMFTRAFGNMVGAGNPTIERHADLYSQGTQISQAQGRYLQARSRLDEVDARLRDTRSIAPFSGVIVKKMVEEGDTVQPGQPMLVFAETNYLQLRVEVPARLMPGLSVGMVVPVRLDVGDTRTEARVAQIFPAADVMRHTVTVKFDLPQGIPGGPGMYGEVLIPDPSVPVRSLPVIPQSAVVWRGSLPGVFVLTPDQRTELRLIRLGERVDGHTITVLSGLHAGEQILMSPPPGTASGWTPGAAR